MSTDIAIQKGGLNYYDKQLNSPKKASEGFGFSGNLMKPPRGRRMNNFAVFADGSQVKRF